MIIKRIYRDGDNIVVVIQGLEDCEPAFALQTVPNADFLIAAIKAKVAEIGTIDHSPPEDPYAQKFEDLKTALEGLDIGD